MSRLKRYAKMASCMMLSAALVFSDCGLTAFAAQDGGKTETETEIKTEIEETEQNHELQSELEAEANSSEMVSEREGNTEEKTEQETETADEITESSIGETVVETVTESEETLSQETDIEMETTQETETETEEETEENALKLAFSDTDIAHGEYKEDGNNITWVIDKDGKLTVEGTGDFASIDVSSNGRASWIASREYIQSAVIHVKNTKNASWMFEGCSNLKSLDLSDFDTSQVTDMGSMFFWLQQFDKFGFKQL